jgi:hypothetical protein
LILWRLWIGFTDTPLVNGRSPASHTRYFGGVQAQGQVPISEHDDDLESIVEEGAESEIDAFPASGDEIDAADREADDSDEDRELDEDEAEL